jgi:hypothetical protein
MGHKNIDQDLRTTATPEFVGINLTGGPGSIDGLDTEAVEYSAEHDHVNTVQDVLSHVWSPGACYNGFDLTDNGNGTVDVDAGSVVLRETNTKHGNLVGFAVPAATGLGLTDEVMNYIIVDYNAGTPQLAVSTDLQADVFDDRTSCLVYAINRLGNTLYSVDIRGYHVDFVRENAIKDYLIHHIEHSTGAWVSDLGNQQFSVTEGIFYLLNQAYTAPALDTSDTGTFEYVYRDGGGGWTRVAASTDIDADNYDDGSGTLAAVPNNKFGAHYLYAVINTPSVYKVVYGQDKYASLAEAQAATIPDALPSDLDVLSTAVFIAKIITQEGVTAFADIQSPFLEQLASGQATQHNALAGLQGGAVNDYQHLTSAELSSIQTGDIQTESDLAIKERTGFVNQADSTLSKVDGTRTFTIQPASGSYDVFSANKKITISSTQSVVWPDTEGPHYFYLDTAGVLQENTSFDPAEYIYGDKIFVGYIIWDADNKECLLDTIFDERHGMAWPGEIHYYMHENEGLRIVGDGLALTDIVPNTSGDLDIHAQFGVSSGVIFDEDIPKSVSTIASTVGLPVIYLEGAGADWRNGSPISGFSVLNTGTGRMAWNEFTGGAWQLSEVANNAHVNMHYLATTAFDGTKRVFGIVGQNTYASVGDARTGAETERFNLVTSTLVMAEFKFLGTVIFQTGDGRDNQVKAEIRSTDAGDDYIDLRGLAGAGSGATSPPSNQAGDIILSTTNFDNNLSAADSNVQAALETLDDATTLWQEPVLGAGPAELVPESPSIGDRYIVVAAAGFTPIGGAWDNNITDIAEWNGTSWDFESPEKGWHVVASGTSTFYVFAGSAWYVHNMSNFYSTDIPTVIAKPVYETHAATLDDIYNNEAYHTVVDTSLTTPPGSPSDFDKYVVAATATGDWAGKEGQIAIFIPGSLIGTNLLPNGGPSLPPPPGYWVFVVPEEGWKVYDQTADAEYLYNGTGWIPSNIAAANYYVATTGNDTTGDGSVGSPWATLTHALSQLRGMQLPSTKTKINMAAGNYTGEDAEIAIHTDIDGDLLEIEGAGYTQTVILDARLALEEGASLYRLADLAIKKSTYGSGAGLRVDNGGKLSFTEDIRVENYSVSVQVGTAGSIGGWFRALAFDLGLVCRGTATLSSCFFDGTGGDASPTAIQVRGQGKAYFESSMSIDDCAIGIEAIENGRVLVDDSAITFTTVTTEYSPALSSASGIVYGAGGSFIIDESATPANPAFRQITTTDATINNLDVTGVNSVGINTIGGSITLNGFTGGVTGQILHVFKANASNTLTINHRSASGDEQILTPDDSSAITLSNLGGVTLVYNGSSWTVIGQ